MAESGIYEIVNLVNGKRYVGSACHLRKRKTDHWKLLRRGSHHSRYLQASWNKHGEGVFEFRLVELVENKSRLLDREQHYLDTLHPEYNIHKNARSALGVKRSPESIAKRVAKFPKSFGPETRRKVGAASRRAWEDPAVRAKLEAARRTAWDNPERRRKGIEALHRMWADPEIRAKLLVSRKGSRNPATDHTHYTLIHGDGRTVSGIQLELRPLTGISPAGLTQLLKGKQQTAKGWRLASP